MSHGAKATLRACALLALAALLLPACAATPPDARLSVGGKTLHVVAKGSVSVAGLLAEHHLSIPKGRLLAVVSRHVLQRSTTVAPKVTVDGRPASLETYVSPGDRVRVVAGVGQEPVRMEYVAASSPFTAGSVVQPIDPQAPPGTEAGWPDVLHRLWSLGRLPARLVMAGSVSGEQAADLGDVPAVPAAAETRPEIALTFDDGPQPTWTPQVLQILQEEGIHATFCLIGDNVINYPGLVKEEVAQGNTVCDHTMDHDEHLNLRSASDVQSEIGGALSLITQAGGVRPAFYRPPGGTLDTTIIDTARSAGMHVLFWTIDTSDYLRPPSSYLLQEVLTQVQPGDIVLFHDGGGDRSHTVAILKQLIDTLRQRGYSFTTPGQETAPALPPPSPLLSHPYTYPDQALAGAAYET
ncbi:MAG: polysaccharide deacetylase family protein [Candidatus Dormibacteraceae bacterium]